MILQELNKQFAIKCFAQFMTKSKVVHAFIEEFQDELPNLRTEWHVGTGFLCPNIAELINQSSSSLRH